MIKETCSCGAHIETHMSRFQDVYKENEIVKAWRKEHKHVFSKPSKADLDLYERALNALREQKDEDTKIKNEERPITSLQDWRLEEPLVMRNDPDIIGD